MSVSYNLKIQHLLFDFLNNRYYPLHVIVLWTMTLLSSHYLVVVPFADYIMVVLWDCMKYAGVHPRDFDALDNDYRSLEAITDNYEDFLTNGVVDGITDVFSLKLGIFGLFLKTTPGIDQWEDVDVGAWKAYYDDTRKVIERGVLFNLAP